MTGRKRGTVRNKIPNRPWKVPTSTQTPHVYRAQTYTERTPEARAPEPVPDPAAEAAQAQAQAERDAKACAKHTACPEEAHAWAAWAKKMGVTHKPRACAGCGRYKIWEKK